MPYRAFVKKLLRQACFVGILILDSFNLVNKMIVLRLFGFAGIAT